MAQVEYRANLTAAEFPLLSEFQGRSVIIPGPDQNFSRQLTSTRNKDKYIGIPQAYYGHNIIPTDSGFASVAYQTVGTPPVVDDAFFTSVFLVRDASENTALLGITSSGNCYVLLAANSAWLKTTSVAAGVGGVTVAHVNGVSYIYFGSVGCYTYNFTTNVLDAVVLTALTAANILGLCAASGYLCAYTKTDLLYSSSVSVTDFTPSLITGAGGGSVQETKANITCVLPHAVGLVIYTKKNAVVGFYTGNAQAPFRYVEIKGSGGVSSLDVVSYDANTTDHYAYTTNGLETIGSQVASVVFPQVTDFLAGSQFEDFDETTCVFTQTAIVSGTMLKKLTLISDRYLVISYGINEYTHALLYDLGLERWSKFKITHTDCFEYSIISSTITETPRRSIGFLQKDGTVKIVLMSYDVTGSYGVLVLGKYQYERNQYLELQHVELENIKTTAGFSCTVLSSLDGKNASINPNFALTYSSGNFRTYSGRAIGVNHSLVFAGAFHVNSLELKFIEAGTVRQKIS